MHLTLYEFTEPNTSININKNDMETGFIACIDSSQALPSTI